jgi:NhaP-type Na+/H+ or K+/H+ antiporter
VGFGLGLSIGRLSIALRVRLRDTAAPTELLALSLIALSYVAAEAVGAWGFLSVFAAGFGLRRAELKVVLDTPHPDVGAANGANGQAAHPPAEDLVPPKVAEAMLSEPAVAAGVLLAETLSFGQVAERLIEVGLVVLIGAYALPHWDSRALWLGLLLFVFVRPVCAHLMLIRTPTTNAQRWLMGWFGIRGIGSLYYLTYALNHADPKLALGPVVDLTVSVVALSILVHGISATPALSWYERALRRQERARTGRGA